MKSNQKSRPVKNKLNALGNPSRRAYTGKNLHSAVLQNKFRREPRTVAHKGVKRNIYFLEI